MLRLSLGHELASASLLGEEAKPWWQACASHCLYRHVTAIHRSDKYTNAGVEVAPIARRLTERLLWIIFRGDPQARPRLTT
jgi:hypothetical protein